MYPASDFRRCPVIALEPERIALRNEAYFPVAGNVFNAAAA
jgi:hypothetical protein